MNQTKTIISRKNEKHTHSRKFKLSATDLIFLKSIQCIKKKLAQFRLDVLVSFVWNENIPNTDQLLEKQENIKQQIIFSRVNSKRSNNLTNFFFILERKNFDVNLKRF